MTIHAWIAFSIAAAILLVIPGPTILSVISLSLAHGRRAVVPLVAGVVLGDLTAMSLSLLGLGAVMAASATLFSTLKILGALYLIYLGVKLWRNDPEGESSSPETGDVSRKSLAGTLFLTTTLNPKSIAFFIAFLPQFVDSTAPALPQLLVLGATFLVLGGINATLYAIFAGHLREKLQRRRTRRWFHRCGGAALVGAGLATATMSN